MSYGFCGGTKGVDWCGVVVELVSWEKLFVVNSVLEEVKAKEVVVWSVVDGNGLIVDKGLLCRVFLVDIVKIVGMIVVVVVDFMVDFVLLFDETVLITDVVFDGIIVEWIESVENVLISDTVLGSVDGVNVESVGVMLVSDKVVKIVVGVIVVKFGDVKVEVESEGINFVVGEEWREYVFVIGPFDEVVVVESSINIVLFDWIVLSASVAVVRINSVEEVLKSDVAFVIRVDANGVVMIAEIVFSVGPKVVSDGVVEPMVGKNVVENVLGDENSVEVEGLCKGVFVVKNVVGIFDGVVVVVSVDSVVVVKISDTVFSVEIRLASVDVKKWWVFVVEIDGVVVDGAEVDTGKYNFRDAFDHKWQTFKITNKIISFFFAE
jgi:hypothetical protein